MKNRGSGAAGRAGNAGSVSRALTTNSASSPNNPEALPFRVFLDSPISNGGRKWRMLAGIFLEFSVVAAAIAIPVWFTQHPDLAIPGSGSTTVEIYVPQGNPGAKPGSKGDGASEAPVPTSKLKPNFDRGGELLYRTDVASTSQPTSGEGDDWIPSDGSAGWGHQDGIEGGMGFIIPTDGPPRAQPPPKYRPTGGNLQPPRQIVRVEPRYPLVAQRARIEGDVILKVLISDRGEIDAVMIVDGHPLLARVAKQAVERWRYEPTLLNGQPIAVSMDVVVRFRIRQ